MRWVTARTKRQPGGAKERLGSCGYIREKKIERNFREKAKRGPRVRKGWRERKDRKSVV